MLTPSASAHAAGEVKCLSFMIRFHCFEAGDSPDAGVFDSLPYCPGERSAGTGGRRHSPRALVVLFVVLPAPLGALRTTSCNTIAHRHDRQDSSRYENAASRRPRTGCSSEQCLGADDPAIAEIDNGL